MRYFACVLAKVVVLSRIMSPFFMSEPNIDCHIVERPDCAKDVQINSFSDSNWILVCGKR